MNFAEFPALKKGFTCPEEAELMWNILHKYKPKTCVEIGRRAGTSTHLIALAIKEWGGCLWSIDGGLNAYAEKRLTDNGLRDYVVLVKGWSPWVAISPQLIDFLYIDGDHNFMSVIVDYHYWQAFLNTGCPVLFHDANFRPVKKAIEHCKRRDQLKEIGCVGELLAFEKTRPPREVYFEHRKSEFRL